MFEILLLFFIAAILGVGFLLLLRAVAHFNQNRLKPLISVPFVKKKDRQLIDAPFILILFPSALQAILLSQVPLEGESLSAGFVSYAIAVFLLLNMVAYMLVASTKKDEDK